MKDYKLSPEAIVMIAGSSAGTQPKYYDHGYWFKADQNGYESEAEYLSSLVLSCSNCKEYVSYERCTINGRRGVRSGSFLGPDEMFITFQRLYDMMHGGNLSERIMTMNGVPDRLRFVVSFIMDSTGIDCTRYLSEVLSLDCLTLNTDRHFNNLGIILNRNNGEGRCAPIFDNGDALLSNYGKYPPDVPLEENMEKTYSQPFSANFEIQAQAAGITLAIDYDKAARLLSEEPETRAKTVLQKQLLRYEKVFRAG